MLRKFIVYCLSLIVLALFASPALAQSATPSSIPVPTTVSPTSPVYTDLLVHNMFHSFSCLAIGQSVIGQPCLTYQITQNAQGAIQSVPVLSQVNLSGGTLGAVTGVIGAMYQYPPVRTADYLASVGEGLGIVKEANAQVVGSGAKVLNPILTLWQVSRNISYLIMIIIFVIIGLMVMFRNRINPQTVITAQAALPGLVIGLIMITFSYFLAGLIADTAFIGTNVVGYYFAAAQGETDDPDRTNLVQTLAKVNVLQMFGNLAGIVTREQATNVVQSIYDSFTEEVKVTIAWFSAFLAFQTVGPLGGVAGPYALIAGPALGVISGLVANRSPVQILGYVLPFIATFVLIYAMIKLLLRLVNSYLTIIFLTITAPFQLLFASLPGRQGLATEWIMNLLGNILVFPAVIAVFYFVAFILGHPTVRSDFPLKISNSNQIQNNDFIPYAYAQAPFDFETSPTFPLFGNLNLEFIKLLLAFGALVALPAIPDIIIKTVGKASQAGQLIGQEIGGSTRAGQGYFSQHTGRITQGGQSISTGIAGETQWIRSGGEWVPYTGKPGLWSFLKGDRIVRGGGSGRT